MPAPVVFFWGWAQVNYRFMAYTLNRVGSPQTVALTSPNYATIHRIGLPVGQTVPPDCCSHPPAAWCILSETCATPSSAPTDATTDRHTVARNHTKVGQNLKSVLNWSKIIIFYLYLMTEEIKENSIFQYFDQTTFSHKTNTLRSQKINGNASSAFWWQFKGNNKRNEYLEQYSKLWSYSLKRYLDRRLAG